MLYLWISDNYSKIIGYSGANRSNITIPPSKNGKNLTTIGGSALRYLSLTGGVTIPSTVNSIGTPIYFGKGTKCMVIEAFDKKLYATVEDSIFALEEIPEVETYSKNFDQELPTEPKKIYIPKMIHPWKRNSFEKFAEKQLEKSEKELEEQAS